MKKLSLSKYFKTLAKIHATLIFVQLFFILATLFLRLEDFIVIGSGDFSFFRYVLPVFVFAGLLEGNRIYKRKTKIASGKSTLAKKLSMYRKGVMVCYSFWMISSLASVGACLLTGNWFYLALSGLVVVLFLANRPTIDRAKRELDL